MTPKDLKISKTPDMAVGTHFHTHYDTKLPQNFYLLIEKPLGCYFQQKTPIAVSSKRQVRFEKAKKGYVSKLIN